MGLTAIPWVLAGLIALGAVGFVVNCKKIEKEHQEFIDKLRHDAQEQERQNKDRADKEKAAKEKADADTQRNLDDLHRTIARLRDERARAGSVPAAPANASRPELACFDRAELARAVGNFEAGVEDLIGKGAEATVELDAAKGWALKLSTELSGK